MPRPRLLPLTLLCLLAFAGRAAHAASPSEKDARKAESVVAKLRLLDDALASRDAGARRKAAGTLPGLFVGVSELRDGDLKTDLSTAVWLYDSALRARGVVSDCEGELRESYSRLCRENAGGDRASLLLAKARLHARRAEAELSYLRGERDDATRDALAELRAERSTDLALADEALRALKELAARANARDRVSEADSDDRTSASFADALAQVDRLLASLPRGHVEQLLRNARDAFRDGLYWQLKTLPSRALVVNVSSLASPDPLAPTGLDPDAAARAAADNLRGAQRFIAKAEEALKGDR
jgi:hypothetical protein